jgi:outer membrane protein OmpA-like peptidoglycan-associated protein
VTPLNDSTCVWAKFVNDVRTLGLGAAIEGHRVRLAVVGYADASGQSDTNVTLSESRAQGVRDTLIAEEIPGVDVVAVGRGERNPEIRRPLADDRYVTFRVTVADPQPPPPTAPPGERR